MDWLIKRLIKVGAIVSYHARQRGRYANIFEKIPLSGWWADKFMENYAIIPSLQGIGFKNRNFGGFFPGKEVPKTIFGLRWPRLPHNLR